MIDPTIEYALVPVLGPPLQTAKADEFRFCCPSCVSRGKSADASYHMYVNPVKGKFICHRCKWSGSLDYLMSKLGVDEVVHVADWEEKVRAILKGETFTKTIQVDNKDAVLPDDYKPCMPGTEAYDYLLSRHFTPELIKSRSVGIGTGEHKGMVIFPEWDRSGKKLLFWSSKPYVKWRKKPKNSSSIIGGYVYWLDKVTTDYVFITEGVFDSIVFKNHGTAMLGSGISRPQVYSLAEANYERYYIGMDGDAIFYALKMAYWLFQLHKDVRIMIFPNKADPSSVGVKHIYKYVGDAVKYAPSEVYKVELAREKYNASAIRKPDKPYLTLSRWR